MDLPPSLCASDTITAHLRMILRGVLAVLGMWRLEIPQMLLVHRRISTTLREIEQLLERFRAGRLWQMPQRAKGQGKRRCMTGREPGLPRRFGWLVRAGGHQAAGFGVQLQTVLNAPEMTTLLAASPQARRILRPWCRALAVELPWVHSQPKPRAVRAKRPRPPHPEPAPFKIPLPRGVLSWARREGFGKLC